MKLRTKGSRVLKILVLSHYWYPQNGVPQRRWQWLTSVLVKAGNQVDVVAPPRNFRRNMGIAEWFCSLCELRAPYGRGESGAAGERIFRVVAVPSSSSLTARVVSQISVAAGHFFVALIRGLGGYRSRPDVIVGTVPALPTAMVTFAVAKILRIPYVIDLRDAWPDLLHESHRWNESVGSVSLRQKILSKGPLQLIKVLTEMALDKSLIEADGVMVTSSWLQDELAEKFGARVASKKPKLVTVRNVFPRGTNFEKTSIPRSSRSEINVLYAGTIGRAQNLENVLKAVKIAQELGVDVNLRIIGAGDGKTNLIYRAKDLGVSATFEKQRSAKEMDEPYAWADTALVHLADWEPLLRTVPSKTYELMAAKMHISGVVQGETAELIRTTGAGDIVSPNEPRDLANLWKRLANDPDALMPREEASIWPYKERKEVAEVNVVSLLESVHRDAEF